jgi:hypothetical protein
MAPVAPAPPPGSAVRSVPDALISGGLQAAGTGLAAVRRSTSLLLDAADWMDARVGGWRLHVLGAAAVAGILVQIFGDREHRDLWGFVAGTVFLSGLVVVALAFLARCRDDATGQFSGELLRERVATFFGTLDEFVADFREASAPGKWKLAGRTAVFVSVLVAEAMILALRHDVVAFAPSWIVAVLWVTSLGAIAWWWGRRVEATESAASAFESTPPSGRMERGLGVLPAVVDSAHRVPSSGDPLVDELIGHLCNWRPGRLASESEYQERLFRGLRRSKGRIMKVERERWIKTPVGAKRRVDLLLETSTSRVAVELKARYGAGDCQRAMGQVEEYTEIGPKAVVLVLCAPDSNANVQSLLDKVRKMRDRGLPVVAVLANVAGPKGQLAGAATMLAMQQASAPLRPAPSWATPAVAAGLATTMAFWNGSHPPRGLRALEGPVEQSHSALTSASMTGALGAPSPSSCSAVATAPFHLRPTATTASIGPQYAAGTQLTVYEFTGLRRRASKLFRVQTPDGATGYAFLAPNELSGTCDP